jgi:trans-L-3-hydroxyproline dehydratase
MQSRRVISVVGAHAEGEVGDVIIGGVLPPAGATMFERMRSMERDHDHIRRLLICEPRGSVARHVNLITPPIRPDCDAGLIIMEPTEYPPMSGSNSMCAATVLLETGMVKMTEPETIVYLDTPAGRVAVRADCSGGRVLSVEITNVPSFVFHLDHQLDVAGEKPMTVDVAYGGMIYASVNAKALGFSIAPDEARDLAVLGEKVRRAAREQIVCVHPENPDISGVSIVQFAMPFEGVGQVTRNTCIVSPGRSDRSPTGTGTSARMAILRARGQMQVGDGMTHASIIGSQFHGRILSETTVGDRPAIIPAIKGRAWITGMHQYFIDPDDPWPQGYVLSDTWGVGGSVSQA